MRGRVGLPGVSTGPLSSYRDKQVMADQPIRSSVHSGKVWGVMQTLSFPCDFSFDLPYKASTACNNQEICVGV